MLVLTNDPVTFTVPDFVVRRCGTLRHAADTGDASHEEIVPAPNVSSGDMARIVSYYSRMDDLTRIGAPPTTLATYKIRFFEAVPRPELFQVMEAANYLDAGTMLDDACAYVADLIRGCPPDRIREIFMLPRDMTTEETRVLAERFEWALK